MTKDGSNYQDLRLKLDDLVNWFENEDIDVDKALEKYQEAEELIKQLQTYLKQAEQKIKIHKVNP